MPWCESCDRYLTPTSLESDGTCPSCDSGVVLAEQPERVGDTVPRKLPWHFKLMVALAGVYLAWRVVDLVLWLF